MARIRSLHPGWFTDEAVLSCSPLARILVLGLWTEADDKGVFEWKPVQLKVRILPVDTADAAALLDELASFDLVRRFEVAGKSYGAVRNFRRWQRPKKPNSLHPLPSELHLYVGLPPENSEPVRNQFGTGGEKSPQMEDVGCRREEEGGRTQPPNQEEGSQGKRIRTRERVDEDGVIHEEPWGGIQ